MYEKVIEKEDNRKRRNRIDCLNAFLTKFLQLALLSSGFNNHNKKMENNFALVRMLREMSIMHYKLRDIFILYDCVVSAPKLHR